MWTRSEKLELIKGNTNVLDSICVVYKFDFCSFEILLSNRSSFFRNNCSRDNVTILFMKLS